MEAKEKAKQLLEKFKLEPIKPIPPVTNIFKLFILFKYNFYL